MLSSQPVSYQNLDYNNITGNGQCYYSTGQNQVATPFSVRDILKTELCTDDSTNLFEPSLSPQDGLIQSNTTFCDYENCNSVVQDAYQCVWNNYPTTCLQENSYCEQQPQQQFDANKAISYWENVPANRPANHQVVPGMTSQHVQHLSHLTPPFCEPEVGSGTSKRINSFTNISLYDKILLHLCN